MANRYHKIFAGPASNPSPEVLELKSASALKPGMVVTVQSGLFVQATAPATGPIYVIQDNYLSGETVDENIEAGDTAFGIILTPGMLINVLLAAAETVSVGDPLTTNATGRVVAATAGDQVYFAADETFNNDTGAQALCRVRVVNATTTAA